MNRDFVSRIMMRELLVCLVVTIIGTIITGCIENKPTESLQSEISSTKSYEQSANSLPGQISSSEQNNKGLVEAINKVKSMTDEEIMEKYATNLDICLIGDCELVFEDPLQINSDTLWLFFMYTLSLDENSNGGQQWYNSKDNLYHVPITDIKKVLDKYFVAYRFVPEELSNFDSGKNEIVQATLSGFGGSRYPQHVSREILSDKLTLKVKFFDENYKQVFYMKTYTILIEPEGYKYLAIIRE